MLISIEGNIGAGKKALLRKIYRSGAVTETFPDFTHEWQSSGLIEDFLRDPPRFCFAVQAAQLHHCGEFKDIDTSSDVLVCTRSFKSAEAFRKVFRKRGHLEEHEYMLLNGLQLQFQSQAKQPDHYVYLRTPIDKCLSNIRKRNSSGERAITYDFLKDVHEAYEKAFVTEGGDNVTILEYKGERSLSQVTAMVNAILKKDRSSQAPRVENQTALLERL